MHVPPVHRYLALFAILLLPASSAWSQAARKRPKHLSPVIEKTVRTDSDGRDRKTMGSAVRGGRTAAKIYSPKTLEKVDDKKPHQPVMSKLKKAGSFDGDLRSIPYEAPIKMERVEREGPEPNPQSIAAPKSDKKIPDTSSPTQNAVTAATPAPTPLRSFDGLDFATWGAGHPPDTNGDVGPQYYIQTVNTSIGIYDKLTGARTAAFTFNTFMSQGHFGNLCDTNNFGDPVVLYDSFEDRWVITDFAFTLDGSGNVINPPGNFQCIAVSKTSDPVTGGWNFYSINTTGGLGDYPKFGIWPDGIYMSVNLFGYPSGALFQNPRVYAFNKAQMYAGSPTVQVVSFDAPAADFTILPSNARLKTGTPPAGTPNYFVSTWEFLNAVTVYKFHVDWDRPALSTFAGPDSPLASTSWPNSTPVSAPSQSGNALDVIPIRAMVQNQYSNIGGVESLWTTHTVRRGNTAGFAAPRWYQIDVSGGTVAANLPQAATWDPDGSNVIYRFVPSLAVNRAGDLALGYSTSSNTTKPALKYAGRLANDPVNTFSQTEQLLLQGAGTQKGNCGGSPCIRWGDYSSMTLDPDGCTFWYTNEYYAADNLADLTRIGAFAYPSCVALANNGGLQGTVRSAATNQPLPGATVSLGSRSTLTDATGQYSFSNLPQGLYQSASAAFSGYDTSTASNLAIADGNVAVQDFSLTAAPDANCFSDTSQADFQTGIANNIDLTTSAGDASLSSVVTIDANTAGTTTGTGVATGTWEAQTFIASGTGQLTTVDVQLFCSGCTGTTPNLTLSLRNVAAGLPSGADLAAVTIPGFSSGAITTYTVTFSSPPSVTSGTRYAIVLRPTSNPSIGGGYFWIRASPDSYANGERAVSGDNGVTWTADTTRDFNFKTYIHSGIATTGDLTSSVKDSNPAGPGTNTWGSLTWTATVPANTTLQFQAAGSNSPFGPFNFVGPDGTASTFFANGGSLAEFNGLRYLKYKAFFTSSDSTKTAILNDVTICNTNPRVWTGAVSSDWNNGANWSSSGVPGAGDVANIPSVGVLNNPASGIDVSVDQLMIGDGRVIDLGANSLTVNDCASTAVSGGSTTSFVKGKLIRCINGAGPYAFPVGTTAGYAPVTLNGTAGSGTFTVNPVDGVLLGADPTKSIHRSWDLTPSGVTQASITLNYQASDVPVGADESSFKFLRFNGSGTFAFAPDSIGPAHTFTLNNVTTFSSWSVGTLLAPTAAPVTLSGRVVTRSGMGINGARVTLIDSTGSLRAAITNPFGYYSFAGVTAGRTYVMSVEAKKYRFSTRSLTVGDSIADFDFVALP